MLWFSNFTDCRNEVAHFRLCYFQCRSVEYFHSCWKSKSLIWLFLDQYIFSSTHECLSNHSNAFVLTIGRNICQCIVLAMLLNEVPFMTPICAFHSFRTFICIFVWQSFREGTYIEQFGNWMWCIHSLKVVPNDP